MSEKLLTRLQLAAALDIHSQTIVKWTHAGLPVASPGRRGKPALFSIEEVRLWLKAREDASSNGKILDAEQERAKKDRAQTMLNEQLYKVRDGDLLPRDEVRQAWAKELMGARAVLLTIPQTFAARIHRAATQDGEPGVERALHDAVNEVLRELGDPGRGVKKSSRRPRRKKKAIRKKTIRKKKATSKKKTSRKK